jgi:hypothetical protein
LSGYLEKYSFKYSLIFNLDNIKPLYVISQSMDAHSSMKSELVESQMSLAILAALFGLSSTLKSGFLILGRENSIGIVHFL